MHPSPWDSFHVCQPCSSSPKLSQPTSQTPALWGYLRNSMTPTSQTPALWGTPGTSAVLGYPRSTSRLGVPQEQYDTHLVCCFQLGIKLTEDLFQVLADHISQHIQPAPEDQNVQGCHLAPSSPSYTGQVQPFSLPATEPIRTLPPGTQGRPNPPILPQETKPWGSPSLPTSFRQTPCSSMT